MQMENVPCQNVKNVKNVFMETATVLIAALSTKKQTKKVKKQTNTTAPFRKAQTHSYRSLESSHVFSLTNFVCFESLSSRLEGALASN